MLRIWGEGMTSNTRRFDGTCKCCGRDGLYVKKQKLCCACYARYRTTGSTAYSDRLWREGEEHNGWAFVRHMDEPNMLFRCTRCGEEIVYSRSTATLMRKGKATKNCGCYRKFSPRTERQAESVKAYKDSHYNMTATARKLGVTRQAIDEILKWCEVTEDAE